MKIAIINGPNINLLGVREKDIYGTCTYAELLNKYDVWAKELGIEIKAFQSNVEGEIVNFIQQAYFDHFDGIVINPAAYTHTSVAILDALKAIKLPAIEIHISDVNAREEFRRHSYIREYCIESIIGKGIEGYRIALENMKKHLEESKWVI